MTLRALWDGSWTRLEADLKIVPGHSLAILFTLALSQFALAILSFRFLRLRLAPRIVVLTVTALFGLWEFLNAVAAMNATLGSRSGLELDSALLLAYTLFAIGYAAMAYLLWTVRRASN